VTRPVSSPGQALPTGTVTFLFTDIEGSTRLLRALGERYAEVLDGHHRLVREAIAGGGGTEVGTEGDSFFAAFHTAHGALDAAVAAQRALADAAWPEGVDVRVRMGLHTGESRIADASYVGIDVHRAARISAAAHGGQVLLSSSTAELVRDRLPAGVTLEIWPIAETSRTGCLPSICRALRTGSVSRAKTSSWMRSNRG
jgi:class 3 adenylate cyclase